MFKKNKQFYEFGKFRFSPKEKCLWRDGELLNLSPKALEVLDLLLENHSNVVSREEILEKVWEDTYIEEANLTVAISNLRKEFGKENSKKFIQTVPKKGYRFIAGVHEVFEQQNDFDTDIKRDITQEEIGELPKSVVPEKSRIRWHFVAIILLGVLFLTSFGVWVNYWGDDGLVAIPANKRNIKSVAVLPLKNLSENEHNKTLSLGITDSLISRLGKLNRFAVRPLSAIEKFGESDKDAIAFGKDLKVDAVLVGTIQIDNARLRVNVQLLDVRDGAQIWSKSYDETESDVFKLQDDLSLQVADNLIARISNEETQTLTKRETENKDAFQAYSKAQFYLAKRTEKDIRKAIEFFEKAAELDKDYAAAFIGIADSYTLLSDSAFGYSKPLEHLDDIKNATDRALEINPNYAEAYRAKASLDYMFRWDIESGNKNFEKSISLKPNDAQTHHWYAWNLMAQNRLNEADKEMKLAHELDPTSRIIAAEMGLPLLYAGEDEEALALFRAAVDMDENFFQSQFRLWYALQNMGRTEEALEQTEQMKKLASDDEPYYKIPYGISLVVTGNRKEGEQIYQEMVKRKDTDEYFTPVLLASFAMYLEKKDEMYSWFDNALEERDDFMLYLMVAPDYKRLHDEERFMNLAERVEKAK